MEGSLQRDYLLQDRALLQEHGSPEEKPDWCPTALWKRLQQEEEKSLEVETEEEELLRAKEEFERKWKEGRGRRRRVLPPRRSLPCIITPPSVSYTHLTLPTIYSV